MIKTCSICGKQFEGSGTASYCNGPHYKTCEVCGAQFEWDYKNPKRCCSKECSAKLRKMTISSNLKICELCGKAFQPRSNTQRYCDDDHFRSCPICGKPVKVLFEYDINRCCSTECTNELRRRTCQSKYGVDIASQSDEVRSKLKASALSDETVEKRRQTSIERWGVDNPSKNPDVRAKISATVRSKECQSKMQATCISRYGTPYAMQSPEGLLRYRETIEEKYGVPYYCMTEDCRQSQGNIISSVNRHVGNLLQSAGFRYSFEFKLAENSYDLHIQDTNILLEINPTYTHNSVGNHWGPGLPKTYHRDKTKLASDNGYRCINIWDWDSVDKIVKMLEPKTPLYARNCSVRDIDSKTASMFENMYHLQGSVRNQSVCLGLYRNGELVQIMTFGKPRYNKKYEWELLRLCSDSRYAVVGGAEKLWKHFLINYSPESVISYCDLSKFNGSVYSRLDMKLLRVTDPNKIWSKGAEMITNNMLLQRGYDQLFHTSYGKGTSNEELMLENGWLPVYDCGQAVYGYEK